MNQPHLLIIAPSFCSASEVWLYRQTCGMQRFRVTVLTGHRQNPDQFVQQVGHRAIADRRRGAAAGS